MEIGAGDSAPWKWYFVHSKFAQGYVRWLYGILFFPLNMENN